MVWGVIINLDVHRTMPFLDVVLPGKYSAGRRGACVLRAVVHSFHT